MRVHARLGLYHHYTGQALDDHTRRAERLPCPSVKLLSRRQQPDKDGTTGRITTRVKIPHHVVPLVRRTRGRTMLTWLGEFLLANGILYDSRGFCTHEFDCCGCVHYHLPQVSTVPGRPRELIVTQHWYRNI